MAKAAGISLEFLYNHPPLRSRIEYLRAQQQTTAVTARPAADPGPASQASSIIRTLTAELTASKARHRAEVEVLSPRMPSRRHWPRPSGTGSCPSTRTVSQMSPVSARVIRQ